MKAGEALKILEQGIHGYANIPVMDEKEANRLMSKPSAIFIRNTKPENQSECPDSPKEKKGNKK